MATREEWLALAEKCQRKVDEADKLHLAWAIMRACGYTPLYISDWKKGQQIFYGSNITYSIESIIALIEFELHGSAISFRGYIGANKGRIKVSASISGHLLSVSYAETLPLALCAALCRAMAEKEYA